MKIEIHAALPDHGDLCHPVKVDRLKGDRSRGAIGKYDGKLRLLSEVAIELHGQPPGLIEDAHELKGVVPKADFLLCKARRCDNDLR